MPSTCQAPAASASSAVARLAYAYRARFEKDFLIDLIGYRRYGHNEGDEPSFTQPLMYQVIERQPSVRAKLAGRLEQRGVLKPGEADAWVQAVMNELQGELEHLEPEKIELEVVPRLAPDPGTGKFRRLVSRVPPPDGLQGAAGAGALAGRR